MIISVTNEMWMCAVDILAGIYTDDILKNLGKREVCESETALKKKRIYEGMKHAI